MAVPTFKHNAHDCLVWYPEANGVTIYLPEGSSRKYAESANVLQGLIRNRNRSGMPQPHVWITLLVLLMSVGFLLIDLNMVLNHDFPASQLAFSAPFLAVVIIAGTFILRRAARTTPDPTQVAHAEFEARPDDPTPTLRISDHPEGVSGDAWGEALDQITRDMADNLIHDLEHGQEGRARETVKRVANQMPSPGR